MPLHALQKLLRGNKEMATYKHDCPHCGAKNSTFTVAGEHQHQAKADTWTVLLICGSCGHGAVAEILNHGQRGHPAGHPHDLTIRDPRGNVFHVVQLFPELQQTETPKHLPDLVAKAFREGCEILKISPDAARGMFRKSLELGLKDLSPDVEAWKLEKRIDKLASLGRLTSDLQEWAHELRLDGNDAMHADGHTTKDDAIQTKELTRLILTYLYTLPESVKLMRAERNNPQ